jgi:peptide/nickel transport system permease protein
MLRFILRRLLIMIPTLFAISVVTFAVIQLPPGDYLTTLVATASEGGERIDSSQLAALAERYGLTQPLHVQYLTWMQGILTRGDFGYSFEWNRPVMELLSDRLPLTFILALTTLLISWCISLAIGLYSAIRQYSLGDYVATAAGFVGLAVANFMIALVLMWLGVRLFGQSVGGLFSSDYVDAAWSWGRAADLAAHLWIPILVLGTAGTAALFRILRANLLDELRKPYVVAARARGIPESRLILRYPLRVALNPFVSTIGWTLPALVSGEVVVASFMTLPTTGPLLLNALQGQDMYLAGAVILIVSALTVVGTLVSDILLAALDPRIRLGGT